AITGSAGKHSVSGTGQSKQQHYRPLFQCSSDYAGAYPAYFGQKGRKRSFAQDTTEEGTRSLQQSPRGTRADAYISAAFLLSSLAVIGRARSSAAWFLSRESTHQQSHPRGKG